MFNLSDRVWYRENGPTDTGTIIGSYLARSAGGTFKRRLYTVRWDNGDETDDYNEGQLVACHTDNSLVQAN